MADEKEVTTTEELLNAVDLAIQRGKNNDSICSLYEAGRTENTRVYRQMNDEHQMELTISVSAEDRFVKFDAVSLAGLNLSKGNRDTIRQITQMNFLFAIGIWKVDASGECTYYASTFCNGLSVDASAGLIEKYLEYVADSFHGTFDDVRDAAVGCIQHNDEEKDSAQRCVDKYLEARGWTSRIRRKGRRLSRKIDCGFVTVRCQLVIRVRNSCITISYHNILDRKCPEEYRNDMAIAVLEASRGLMSGTFDIDHSDGEVLFRTHVPIRNGDVEQLPLLIAGAIEKAELAIQRSFNDIDAVSLGRHREPGYTQGQPAQLDQLAKAIGLDKVAVGKDYFHHVLAEYKKKHPSAKPEDVVAPSSKVMSKLATLSLDESKDLVAMLGPDNDEKDDADKTKEDDQQRPNSVGILSRLRWDAVKTGDVLSTSGLLGVTYRGTFSDDDCVVKVVKKEHNRPNQCKKILQELEKQASKPFKFIVQLIGYCEREDEGLKIVSEFCHQGPLGLYLKSNPGLPNDRKLALATNIAEGMTYIHMRYGYPHAALQPSNILVSKHGVAKVGDIGMRSFVSEHLMTSTMVSWKGLPRYSPPEMFSHVNTATMEGDVYAFGIILWQIYTQDVPYERELAQMGTNNEMDLVGRIAGQNLRPSIPDTVPHPISALIQECWQKEPAKRPQFHVIANRLRSLRP